MDQEALLPHLFRTEFSRITNVLCKQFGLTFMETAEDIAGETFLAALEHWPYNGIPPNPVAWLYTVAKNKARNYLTREALFHRKVSNTIIIENTAEEPDIDLSLENIRDSQLAMLFAICHPSISTESQISLALRILCGFGHEEIATALLTNTATIHKRLQRARQKLKAEQIAIHIPTDTEITARLDTVLTTIYLLFNEGYYSESNDAVLQEDLCAEAMRLLRLLMENSATCTQQVHALYALMCFHASRFPARKSTQGKLLLYDEQDIAQ